MTEHTKILRVKPSKLEKELEGILLLTSTREETSKKEKQCSRNKGITTEIVMNCHNEKLRHTPHNVGIHTQNVFTTAAEIADLDVVLTTE